MKRNKAAANITTSGDIKALDTPGLSVDGPGPPVEQHAQQHGPPGEQGGRLMEQRRPPVKVVDESELEEVKSCSSLSNSESLTDVSPSCALL